MKETTGHNWACHADESVLCGGLATFVKRYRSDLDISVGHRISYETWYYEKDPSITLAEKLARGQSLPRGSWHDVDPRAKIVPPKRGRKAPYRRKPRRKNAHPIEG